MKWPEDSSIALDTYLGEYVEVCEPGSFPGTIVCRRFTPDDLTLHGAMMPLPIWYFVPETPLANELLLTASGEQPAREGSK